LISHNQTKSQAVARIANHTGCQWFSRSSKVDDFHLIWKSTQFPISEQ